MKWVINSKRATDLLNRGYLPPGGLNTSAAEHTRIISALKSLLADSARKVGIGSFDEIGGLYEPFQDDHMLRAELLSWRMLEDGLLLSLGQFLQEHAPQHAITLTFDFGDDSSRILESPLITVFSTEIVGGFDHCEMNDTPRILGFTEAEQATDGKASPAIV